MSKSEVNKFGHLDDGTRTKMLREIKKARAPVSVIATVYGVSRNTVIYHASRLEVVMPTGIGMTKDVSARLAETLLKSA
jgi:hypothetical protein